METLYDAGGRLAIHGVALADLLVTLLHHGRLSELDCMFRAGADVNVRDFNGRTLLHWAVAGQRSAVLAMLLAHPHIDTTIADPVQLSSRRPDSVSVSATTSSLH